MNEHTKLSVNINKIATLRNARGRDIPNVLKTALDCEQFGAEGITVHPRPDQRHIRYADVAELATAITTEFNIEGYPNEAFIKLVLDNKPAQVTLVPDSPDVLTSNAGWDTIKHQALLTEVIAAFKAAGIRTSVFIETNLDFIDGAKKVGADRIELYTEDYAVGYQKDFENAIAPYAHSAKYAKSIGLGVNAGHDLSLENLAYFGQQLHGLLDEVSIGHALIADALYLGLHNTIRQYLNCLNPSSWK
ncbi:MAG TPA: pyridoxine 5'-phosphate synthase [Cryomorphaceae bacterium]|nr:pyridoxine 5'-phosphate synthase [Cryomorphaceae bacterium]|tara:strand:- start:1804 stop:2544 length:741 start_codon:yes stop_codon:yes gene_type:complete